MRVNVHNAKREIVAVVGTGGHGLLLRSEDGDVYYLGGDGVIYTEPGESTLEDAASKTGRVPIYAGEKITIEF